MYVSFTRRDAFWRSESAMVGGCFDSMTVVFVRENEPIDPALKRFKKECVKAGIFKEIRSRKHYEKPSERRRRKLAKAIARANAQKDE